MNIKERMHNGSLYYSNDADLVEEQLQCLEVLYDYNTTRPSQQKERTELLKKMFAEVGKDCYIEPPLHTNWGGRHVHMGDGVYANFNLTLVDDTHIYIGNNVMMGPNVVIDSATHPIRPDIRKKQAQYNLPVYIGNNVWIGAGSIILPGVHIGDNSVIGAGSVVSKDIPANVVAVGTPCRVLREINDHDMQYYDKNRRIDIE